MFRVLALSVTFAFASAALGAAEGDGVHPGIFICNAVNVSELSAEGTLANTNFAKAIAVYESRFAVDRSNGVAVGGPFGTWDAKDVQVLSPGTETEGFKVLWLANAAYTHLKYLSVKSYVEGNQKPFLGITGDMVITGLCEAGPQMTDAKP